MSRYYAVMVFKTTEFVGKLTVSEKGQNALANWPVLLEVLFALNSVTNHRKNRRLVANETTYNEKHLNLNLTQRFYGG